MVLVIDDDFRAEGVARLLRLVGERTEVITDIEKTPQYLRDHVSDISLVMIDLLMPDGGVIDAIRAVGGSVDNEQEPTGVILLRYIHHTYPALHILVHSIVRDEKTIAAVRSIGEGVTYLQKPASPQEIVDAVRGAR